MKDTKYRCLKEAIIKHDMALDQITNSVNTHLKEPRVCEQEMLNYLIDPEQMPHDVKEALEAAFNLNGGGLWYQMNMYQFGVGGEKDEI